MSFRGVRPKKRLGQHFLHDPNIVRKIIDAVQPAADDFILEIGPGTGAVTRGLINSGARTTVIEKDPEMVAILQTEFGKRIDIIPDDVLKVDLTGLLAGRQWKIVGNLPYNISSPILFRLRAQHQRIREAVLMLQKEVAERISAEPGGKEYGILAIALQLVADCRRLFTAKPGSFFPPPKVDSAVMRLAFHAKPRFPVDDLDAFQRFIAAAFNQRRKTIKNGLANRYWPGSADDLIAILKTAGIDPARRPETLSIPEFVALYHQLTHQSSVL